MSYNRIHNFSAGPATMPERVLETARDELLNFNGSGMSIMEMSHRGKVFSDVIAETEANIRDLLGVPNGYKVLFLQGGASTQFAMVPMNLLQGSKTADVVMTGSWTKKATKEINKLGTARVIASSEDQNFSYIPTVSKGDFSSDASFALITSNNTIAGTQWHEFPDTGDIPLVADMSSDILSKPIDVSSFGLLYAGAQKNLGPSGVTLVVIRDDLAERASEELPTIFQYRSQIANDSMYNTPPTFAIYMVGLVVKWINDQGGLSAVAEINKRKAKALYDAIENSTFYTCPVREDSRSDMNVVFRVASLDEDLEKQFVKEAEAAGLSGLKGHRSVGGLRASIYNACPEESIQALIDFMHRFEKAHS